MLTLILEMEDEQDNVVYVLTMVKFYLEYA